jgi:hypothetical protein
MRILDRCPDRGTATPCSVDGARAWRRGAHRRRGPLTTGDGRGPFERWPRWPWWL